MIALLSEDVEHSDQGMALGVKSAEVIVPEAFVEVHNAPQIEPTSPRSANGQVEIFHSSNKDPISIRNTSRQQSSLNTQVKSDIENFDVSH
eukprot:CAMPEP_0119044818 /NCGR_PEP_ID=MMETSP1177-20130426/34854_1 /TAXON_ID=2985 /ORGANISM="Ochromonas sp, Strain CCMP1899" /LENGTH=90 /DNA_ID=CAMNT_0007015561 /DNA_START=286 /DNA_END=558 /DNA_ORIENTATION=-